MNLYLISQDENSDYDTYDSAVVAAETEDGARNTHPDGSIWPEWDPTATPWWKAGFHSLNGWVASPEKVTAKLIGTATEGTQAGVILESFNAG